MGGMMVKHIWTVLLCALVVVQAETRFPGPDWEDAPNPLASTLAEPGGTLKLWAGQYPRSFNYYLENSVTAAGIFGLMYETLLDRAPLSMEAAPGLARSWSISEDKLTFTFHLDPDARWSDGRPVTAHDVAWTYRTIMDPAHLTGVHKVSLERLNPPEVIDDHTVRITAKEVHWGNLLYAGGFHILPQHAFEEVDFNRLNFEFPVVSGPYALDRVVEGVRVSLRKREDWWAGDRASAEGLLNFDILEMRFYADRDHAFDVFRRGEFDLFAVYTAHIWMNQTSGERFDRNWIVRQAVHNQAPRGFQGWAMNMRRPPFDDVRVRQALAHLLNREEMNRTLMHSQYALHQSYYEDLYGPDQPNTNPMFNFDKERARELLTEAGWIANPRTGRLEKDGHPFIITFLSNSSDADKFLNIYREDLRDVGILLNVDRKDWAAWTQDMDEFNFDMTWAAWGAGLYKDPEGQWHSREAQRNGGNNITGFMSEEVDALIEAQREMFDPEARHEIVRQIDAILTREVPYILLWNSDHTRLLYWNRFDMPAHVLGKYGREESARAFWWLDELADADLRQAMAENLSLPPRPAVVRFEDVFLMDTLQPVLD
jgi:microcin C transport system substrate-binding protein